MQHLGVMMGKVSSGCSRLCKPVWAFADWVGAHKVPDRTEQERRKGIDRLILCSFIIVTHLINISLVNPEPFSNTAVWMAVLITYALSGLVYYRYLLAYPRGGIAWQYLTMGGDLVFVCASMAYRPDLFGWLSMLILVMTVRTAVRYGLRSLYYAWGCAVVTTVIGWSIAAWNGNFHGHGMVFMSVVACLFVGIPLFFFAIKGFIVMNSLREHIIRLDELKDQINRRMEFLSMVSHELRTPLQAILASIEILELRMGAATDEREIERLGINATAISEQLNDIVTLARGELGAFSLMPRKTSVQDALMEAVEAVRPFARNKGLEIEWSFPEKDLEVFIDKMSLTQVASNLMQSSIKATQSGRVKLTLKEYLPGASWFSFKVEDTACEASKAAYESMLSSYGKGGELVYPSTSAGIGLAVANVLVEFMGGSVHLSRSSGVSDAVVVSLPAATPDGSGVVGDVLVVGQALAKECRELGLHGEGTGRIDEARTIGQAMMMVSARQWRMMIYDARKMDQPEPQLINSLKAAIETGRVKTIKVVVQSVGMWQANEPGVSGVIEEPLTAKKMVKAFWDK